MRSDSGYAYAKASWLIGKSFLEKRQASLAGIHTLNELDRLIFPDNYRELPGRELLADLEKRIIERAVRQILSIVNSYAQPHKLLIRLIKGFEYSDLKECLSSIACGKVNRPVISDIGRFGSVRFDEYPDAAAMLRRTEYENLLSADIKSIKKGLNLTAIETKLDYHYYKSLVESLSQLKIEDDRETAARLLADEISLRNCVWALRLRAYYNKNKKQITGSFLDLKLLENIHQKKSSLAAEAKVSLNFSLDVRKDWHGWRWERFLNSEESSLPWKADPRHFQNAASLYMYHLHYRNFHSLPMSVSAIYCFIKLKQYEEDMLTSVAEGLALGMDSSYVFKLLEAV